MVESIKSNMRIHLQKGSSFVLQFMEVTSLKSVVEELKNLTGVQQRTIDAQQVLIDSQTAKSVAQEKALEDFKNNMNSHQITANMSSGTSVDQTHLAAINARIDSEAARIDDLQKIIEIVNVTLDVQQKRIDASNLEINTLNRTAAALEVTTQRQDRLINKTLAMVDAQQKFVEATNSTFDTQRQIANANSKKINALEASISSLNTTNASNQVQQRSLDAINTVLNDHKKEIDAANIKLYNQQQKLNMTGSKLSQQQKELDSLTLELVHLNHVESGIISCGNSIYWTDGRFNDTGYYAYYGVTKAMSKSFSSGYSRPPVVHLSISGYTGGDFPTAVGAVLEDVDEAGFVVRCETQAKAYHVYDLTVAWISVPA